MSFGAFLFGPKLIRNEHGLAEIGITIRLISFVYFAVTLAECVVFIILKLKEYKLSLLVNLIITSLYLIALIIDTMAEGHALEHQN